MVMLCLYFMSEVTTCLEVTIELLREGAMAHIEGMRASGCYVVSLCLYLCLKLLPIHWINLLSLFLTEVTTRNTPL